MHFEVILSFFIFFCFSGFSYLMVMWTFFFCAAQETEPSSALWRWQSSAVSGRMWQQAPARKPQDFGDRCGSNRISALWISDPNLGHIYHDYSSRVRLHSLFVPIHLMRGEIFLCFDQLETCCLHYNENLLQSVTTCVRFARQGTLEPFEWLLDICRSA